MDSRTAQIGRLAVAAGHRTHRVGAPVLMRKPLSR